MDTFEKIHSLEGHTNDNGEKGYYPIWKLTVYGADIAERYHRLNLKPEAVESIMDAVNEKIPDVMYDLIDEALNEYIGG